MNNKRKLALSWPANDNARTTTNQTNLADNGWLEFLGNYCSLGRKAQKKMHDYYEKLPPDPYGPGRRRAYKRLYMEVATGYLSVANDHSYSQTYKSNETDGGKIRHFIEVDDRFLQSQGVSRLIRANLAVIRERFQFTATTVKVGVHTIRYIAGPSVPAFSSPPWLHKDDEPLVFLNVLKESPQLVGGDNVLAKSSRDICRVVHLRPFEGILLTKLCLHAVTPMEPARGKELAFRDILLTTIEEPDMAVGLR